MNFSAILQEALKEHLGIQTNKNNNYSSLNRLHIFLLDIRRFRVGEPACLEYRADSFFVLHITVMTGMIWVFNSITKKCISRKETTVTCRMLIIWKIDNVNNQVTVLVEKYYVCI